MNPLNPSSRFAALSAAVLAATSGAVAVFQIVHEPSGATTTVGAAEHFAASLFSVMMLALVPAVAFIARRATGDGRLAIPVAVTGPIMATLGLISNVRGEDPAFFAAVAVPSLLTMLVAFTVIAVRGARMHRVPKALAIGLPFVLIVSIPLSQLRGGLLAAAYWVAIAAYALRGSRRATVAPVAAVA